jgi:alpha-amylase/alpha-mannosidase (GH57 family)
MTHFVCIHGHFYQPPRENPWLEEIEIQDSAYPYHDWNERITAECYAPNAASRILDGEGRIARIVNNYSRISFNFGPTLLTWMEDHAPDVYAAIQQADQESQERFSGHGSALAQAYNHMIMPLASRRDKVTQVRWGLRDFEHRFGRKAEGMWLPETAVDVETLDILAEHDIRFTLLSPYQARQVRRRGGRKWYDATRGQIDPRTPYEQVLPSGRRIVVFFYDGPISQGIAFEGLLRRGEDLANRLLGAFTNDPGPQLVHIATDGETYGHHHSHGDMALAYALHYIEQKPSVQLTNYGEFLARFPRLHHVEVAENTAWSCMHGVERWRNNCGCNTGRRGWHQEWRGPLRDALDWLRDRLIPLFEAHAAPLLKDAWAARDDYISVILDRSPENVKRFFERHATRPLPELEITTALKLLEMQRHAMLMYTSCGWFFDELSGIETVQVIQYAGHTVQLAKQLFSEDVETGFVERLAKARSNLAEHGDGRAIYEKWIRPAEVDMQKVTAHYAASSLFEKYGRKTDVYCYQVERQELQRWNTGPAKLAVGRCRVTSTVTRESADHSFACLHLGDHNLLGGVRPFEDSTRHATMKDAEVQAFRRAHLPETIHRLYEHFNGSIFSLSSLFREEQRKIIDLVVDTTRSRAEGMYRLLYEQQGTLMGFLAELGTPIPNEFRTTAQVVLNIDLRTAASSADLDVERIRGLLEQARLWQAPIDEAGLSYALEQGLDTRAEAIRDEPEDLEQLARLDTAVDLVLSIPFRVNLFHTQNIVYDLLHRENGRPRDPVAPAHAAIPAPAHAASGTAGAVPEPEWRARLKTVAAKLSIRVD